MKSNIHIFPLFCVEIDSNGPDADEPVIMTEVTAAGRQQ